jgi:hypothetical protein
MIGTKQPGTESFMKMTSFGQLHIEVTPIAAQPEILSVDIAAENRKEPIHMRTNKDETIDQFTSRVRSMLRALANAEPREAADPVVAKDQPKPKTWEEQKKAMRPAEAKA